MTTLTSSSSTLTIVDSTPISESTGLTVLPLATTAPALGRLVHPTLGTLDYPYAPDEWVGVDTDIIIPPTWAYTPTLGGGANTLWAGSIKDVVCKERWTSDVSMPIPFLRTLLNFAMNPPAPEDGYVQWLPQYTNPHTYNVILQMPTSGGSELVLDFLSRQGWLAGVLELQLRVVNKVS